MDALEILQDIKNKIGKRKIFEYDRDNLIECLIIAVNNLSRDALLIHREDFATEVIEQFRAILKFIFEYSSNNVKKIDKEDTVGIFEDMIIEFANKYTPVRNYLEQCSIGLKELLFDNKNNVFYENNFDKFANYQRVRDRLKDYDSQDIKDKTSMSMVNFWKMNPKTSLFKNRFYKSLMKDFIEACWLDSEIKFEHEFNDFKYSEMITFCASLLMIGEYYFINQMKYRFGFIEENELINGIKELTDLTKDKIIFFLKVVTYDYNYQKDKLTLIQSLIKSNDGYYFCPSTLILGFLPIKMCRSLFDNYYDKYEKDLSIIARLKEKQMTSSIVQSLNKFHLDIEEGFEIINDKTKQSDAEYDIIIFDDKTKNLYIAECKWFYVGDDDIDHNKIDKRIKKSINYRLLQDKYIKNNPDDFVKKVFNKDGVNEVKELLISQNFMGLKRHSMPVIDYDTLLQSIDKNKSFEDVMNYMLDEKYINSIDFEGELFDISLEGYNFKLFKMFGKKQ